MTENATQQEDTEKDVTDYLIGVAFDEVVMVHAHHVRQTINAVYVDSTAELLDDNEYEVAYVCPVADQKKIKAIVAVPESHRMSTIPYPGHFDWLVEIRKYDNIVVYQDGSSAPFLGDEQVL